jgi:hypothetical protein
MNFRRLKLVIALIVVFAAVPAFAGTDCRKCRPADDPSMLPYCAYPDSGQWGTEDCKRECYGTVPNRTCYCTSEGWGCLYQVVEG